MSKRASEPQQKRRHATSLWIDIEHLPTSLARKKTKPVHPIQRITVFEESSQDRYLQLADTALKRATLEPRPQAIEIPKRFSWKIG